MSSVAEVVGAADAIIFVEVVELGTGSVLGVVALFPPAVLATVGLGVGFIAVDTGAVHSWKDMHINGQ